MQFKKFSSLDNCKQAIIDRIRNHGLANQSYWVTEKIHGANFSFYCVEDKVRVASRNQFVDGGFYGCQSVIDENMSALMTLKDIIGDNFIVRGELCGNGIFNSPDYGEKKFLAFDLEMIDDRQFGKQAQFDLLESVGFNCVSLIAKTANLDTALNIEVEFESLAGKGGSEGVVIEPVTPTYIGQSHVYLKNKSARFTEKKARKKVAVNISDSDKALLEELNSYVNEARANNVISKEGEVFWKDFGRLNGLLAKDAMEEADVDKDQFEEWKVAGKEFMAECAVAMRKAMNEVAK